MEAVGGDLNAYTNKEEMVVYSAFLTDDLSRAVELLVDIVFRSTFPQREIERETEVIIDEIQSYEDNPSELIFDDFEDMIFRGHPLGRNILGRPELLRRFRTSDALDLQGGCISPPTWFSLFRERSISESWSICSKNGWRIYRLVR